MPILIIILALITTIGLVKGWNDSSDSVIEKPLWFYFLSGFAGWWILYGTFSKNGSPEFRESWIRLVSDLGYFIGYGIINSVLLGGLVVLVVLIIRGMKASK